MRTITTGTGDGRGLRTPEGVVIPVEQGAQLWAQSHYVNTGAEPITVRDVINLELLDDEAVDETAGTFAHGHYSLSLDNNSETTKTIESGEVRQCLFGDVGHGGVPLQAEHLLRPAGPVHAQVERSGLQVLVAGAGTDPL
jgi:hypothetical protein